ncbi:MAG: hypothetical protein Q4C87_01215 [Actinomycetaceae bacterium]|nr:hypothetical protein [Actinomycetaceae bacterium]
MRFFRYSAAFAIVTAASLVLSACSTGLTSSGITISKPKETTSAPPSLPETQRDTPHPDAPTTPEGGNDSSKRTPDQAQSSQPNVSAQPAPAGWKMVTSTVSPVSFAVPEDWAPIGANVSEEEARANALKASLDLPEPAENLMTMREHADLLYASTNPDHAGDHIYTLKTLLPTALIRSEERIKQEFESEDISVTSISKEQSSLGEVTVIATEREGIVMTIALIPAKENQLMVLYATGLDAARPREALRTIVSTLTK